MADMYKESDYGRDSVGNPMTIDGELMDRIQAKFVMLK